MEGELEGLVAEIRRDRPGWEDGWAHIYLRMAQIQTERSFCSGPGSQCMCKLQMRVQAAAKR